MTAADESMLAPSIDAVTASDPSRSSDVESRLPYLPGLEGIRGVALVLEMGVHTALFLVGGAVAWRFTGASLSMSIFFVLSGFFITALLLIEFEKSGSIRIGRFYWKRARRLFPPLLLMLAGHFLLVLYYGRPIGLEWRQDLWAVFLAINYKYSIHGQDPLLGDDIKILWTLAVEGQFYLIWPFILLGLKRFFRSIQGIVLALICLAFLSTSVRALEYHFWGNWGAVYYRTEGRLDAFFLGGLCGFLWFHKKLAVEKVSRFALLAWIAFAIGIVIARIDQPGLYSWGFLASNILAMVMVVGCLDSRSIMTKVMSWRFLRLLGRVSYSFYIVHIQVFFWVLLQRKYLSTWQRVGLAWSVTVVLGSFCYLVAERPFLSNRPSMLAGFVRKKGEKAPG